MNRRTFLEQTMSVLPMLALTLPEPEEFEKNLVDEAYTVGQTIQRVFPANYVVPIEVKMANGRYALFLFGHFVKESPTKDEMQFLIGLFE